MIAKSSRWYCFTDDESGPFLFSEIEAKVARGELRGNDLIRRVESQQWTRVDATQDLKRFFPESPVQPRASMKRWHRPRGEFVASKLPIGRWGLVAGSFCAIGILLFQLVWQWLRSPERFPQGSAVTLKFTVPSRLQQIRPTPPVQPTLPELPTLTRTLVPGFEDRYWVKHPTLTADLLTIVYVSYSGESTTDDLYIAERKSKSEPFTNHRPITAVQGNGREAFPSLSPDGRDLIYCELGNPTRLWLSQRPDPKGEFLLPTPMLILDDPVMEQHHDAPQFIDQNTIQITCYDDGYRQRQQMLARRSRAYGPFRWLDHLPVSDASVRYFVSAERGQAYFPTADGVYITARHPTSNQFVTPELLLANELLGTNLVKFDDAIWVSPQEDVIFYCSPGDDSESRDHRLWMLRF